MKYRKKPVVIEAVQWTGGNAVKMADFMDNHDFHHSKGHLLIKTLEGVMIALTGDYIIKGVEGEFYPCKPEIFKKTYEVLE